MCARTALPAHLGQERAPFNRALIDFKLARSLSHGLDFISWLVKGAAAAPSAGVFGKTPAKPMLSRPHSMIALFVSLS